MTDQICANCDKPKPDSDYGYGVRGFKLRTCNACRIATGREVRGPVEEPPLTVCPIHSVMAEDRITLELLRKPLRLLGDYLHPGAK